MKKSKFLTFVFSLLPGAGHMYLGLTKKGILFMASFFGIIFISNALYFAQLWLILPIIWFYSFFDALNHMNYTVEELRVINVNYSFPFLSGTDAFKGKFSNVLKGKNKIVGVVLIFFGIYFLIDNFIIRNSYDLFGERIAAVINRMFNMIPAAIIPVIIIFIGFKLVIGGKKDEE